VVSLNAGVNALYACRTAALKRREERKKRKREEEKAAAEAKVKAAADARAAEKPAETEPAVVKTEVKEVPAPVKQETQNGGSAPEPEEVTLSYPLQPLTCKYFWICLSSIASLIFYGTPSHASWSPSPLAAN